MFNDSPSISNSSASPAPSATSALKTAVKFVSAYYKALATDTEQLYTFYEDDSVAVRIQEEEQGKIIDHEPSQGQLAIHNLVLSLGYSNCRVMIESLDCQESFNDSLLILVTGLIILVSDPSSPKSFIQSFFLTRAEQEREGDPIRLYIRNDIQRYLERVPHAVLQNNQQSQHGNSNVGDKEKTAASSINTNSMLSNNGNALAAALSPARNAVKPPTTPESSSRSAVVSPIPTKPQHQQQTPSNHLHPGDHHNATNHVDSAAVSSPASPAMKSKVTPRHTVTEGHEPGVQGSSAAVQAAAAVPAEARTPSDRKGSQMSPDTAPTTAAAPAGPIAPSVPATESSPSKAPPGRRGGHAGRGGRGGSHAAAGADGQQNAAAVGTAAPAPQKPLSWASIAAQSNSTSAGSVNTNAAAATAPTPATSPSTAPAAALAAPAAASATNASESAPAASPSNASAEDGEFRRVGGNRSFRGRGGQAGHTGQGGQGGGSGHTGDFRGSRGGRGGSSFRGGFSNQPRGTSQQQLQQQPGAATQNNVGNPQQHQPKQSPQGGQQQGQGQGQKQFRPAQPKTSTATNTISS